MPQKLPLSVVQDKNLIASSKAYLVCLEIDVRDPLTQQVMETLYLVNNEEDITFNSQVYTAFAFSLNLTNASGEQTSVSLTINDVSRAIQSKMQQYGGGVGFLVRIVVVFEADLTSPPEIVENFEVIGASTQDYSITWTLGTQNLLAKKFPNRRQLRDRCHWDFKSNECGYSGAATSCDYTLDGANGCDAKGNSLRFGGFPGIRASNNRYV